MFSGGPNGNSWRMHGGMAEGSRSFKSDFDGVVRYECKKELEQITMS